MSYYFIAIGGSGAKVLESLTHLSAAGAFPDEESLYVMNIDPDVGNGNLARSTKSLQCYEKGKWDVEPTEIVSGIEDVVYVYLFDKIAETEPQPQPTTVQPTPTVKTVVQEKTVYKTQYVEPITLKTGDNLIFLGVLVGLCAAGFAGTIIFGKKRSK